MPTPRCADTNIMKAQHQTVGRPPTLKGGGSCTGHEGDEFIPVLHLIATEDLPGGGLRKTFKCPNWAEFFCMPSGFIVGPFKYQKVRHDAQRAVAVYEAEAPAEQFLQE
jgi:hypothetical protein